MFLTGNCREVLILFEHITLKMSPTILKLAEVNTTVTEMCARSEVVTILIFLFSVYFRS